MPADTDMLFRKLDSVAHLKDEDRQTLAALPVRIRELDPDEDVAREGEAMRECCLLIEGFMHRYKVLADGKRQILAFHTPGDIPDLHSLSLATMDHSVAAITRCRAGFISHEHLRAVMDASPRIRDALARDTEIDASIFRAWITGMGQRSAYGHMAHLFCEVFTRLRAVGLTGDGSCDLPMTQEELGDALGLSTVHVNRTLQELRSAGLISLDKGRLTILDWEGLVQAAQFDPAYLHLRRPLVA